MSGLLHTPWGKLPDHPPEARREADRGAERPVLRQDDDRSALLANGDLVAVPEFDRTSDSRFQRGREAASQLVHTQKNAGSSPAPATSVTVQLGEAALLSLRLVACERRCSLDAAVAIAAAFYCESAIGLQRCADLHSVLAPCGAPRLAPDGARDGARAPVESARCAGEGPARAPP